MNVDFHFAQVRPGDVAAQENVRAALGIGPTTNNSSDPGKRIT